MDTPSQRSDSVVDSKDARHHSSLEKNLSEPDPPPDGGVQAWLQAVMAHLVMFNTWGYINSFGLFQSYYTTTLDASPSAISWLGSLQICLVFFVGAFAGRATDAGHYRKVLALGSLLQIIGVFMTSLCKTYWQLVLAQGICTGLGDGLTFCPTIALLATYFTKNRAIAIAINAAGAGTGGIVFPLIAQQLLPKIGFGWTVRIMGFVILFNAAIALTLARTRLPPRKPGPIVEWAAFKELPYCLFCIGAFLSFWAIFFAFYYISVYGKSIIGVSTSTSLTILLVMNAIGVPARFILGILSDRVTGPMNILIPTTFFAGLLFYCWAAVDSKGGLFAFCIVYGFWAAGIQSLFPAACANLTTDLTKMGLRTGMVFTIVSIACLTGPPLAGALVQKDNGRFLFAQMFGGSSLLAGAAFFLSARIAKVGLNFSKRM